jgi:ferritin-like metal-binding protein YciE
MNHPDIRQLYVDELKDLYSAENQLVKALPKMAKASTSDELRQAFEDHLEQTKEHVQRLETIFEALDENPKGKKCVGMEGLVEEGAENISEYEGEVRDAAIIGGAQRVEHYEIAAYGTAIAFAELLQEQEHVSLMKETLQEEKDADAKLTQISEKVNSAAQRIGPSSAETRGKRKSRIA